MYPARRAIVSTASLLLAFALSISGCDCDDNKITPNCACTSDEMCQDVPTGCESEHSAIGDNTYCNLDTQRCFQDKFECDPSSGNDGDCCPGQICSPLAQICTNKYTTCTDSSTCLVAGQVCKPLGTPEGDNGCTFEFCDADGECADGLTCFNGSCVGAAPCNGGCPAGQVCVPSANRCFKPGSEPEWPGECQQSCAPGTILVFVDGQNVFDRCDRSPEARACGCEALPPIEALDTARYSSSVAAGGKILVSAYDADHGDLVLHTFNVSGKREKTEWIDGIPTEGAVTADPNGPRSGRAGAGADVGLYTSIGYDASSDTTHIAYYANENAEKTKLGDLRYARRTASGAWNIHVVDGETTGDVGLYTSLTLNAEGYPVISYFQRGGVGNDEFKTALKVARAKVKAPASASDWNVVTVDEGVRTAPPCSLPSCTQEEVCTASTTNPNGQCRVKATGCETACSSDQACALNAVELPVCYTSLRAATLASLPEGNGLFSSIAYVDNKPVVVWYDQNEGVLRAAIASSDSSSAGATFDASGKRVLDDGVSPDGMPKRDVGRFASIAVGPSDAGKRLAVSYFDTTARQLRVLTADSDWSNVTPLNLRVADDGTGNREIDPVLFVGSDTSIAFDSAKNVVVAYQDATSGDLRIAKKKSGSEDFAITSLRTEGACGFYASIAKDGGNLFVSHAIIKAATSSKSANRLEVVAVP